MGATSTPHSRLRVNVGLTSCDLFEVVGRAPQVAPAAVLLSPQGKKERRPGWGRLTLIWRGGHRMPVRGIYNLQGQRVRETIPGQFYIINGKKTMVNSVIRDTDF